MAQLVLLAMVPARSAKGRWQDQTSSEEDDDQSKPRQHPNLQTEPSCSVWSRIRGWVVDDTDECSSVKVV